MNMVCLRTRVLGAFLMALVVSLFSGQARADFPTFKELSETNVSLKIEGFRFASGLRLENGKPNGKGTELVPAGWCGSGFLVKSDGTLITNYHVAQRMLRGTAIFQGGANYEIAHIRVYNRENDIAIVKLKTTTALPTVQLGDSNAVQVMDKVLAVGNPLSFPQCKDFSVTDGSVNQLRRHSKTDELVLLQHSAPLAPGNSGGALYRDKEVVGINVAIRPPYQISYAIPINKAKPLLEHYGDRTIHLEDAFPTDVKPMVKKFEEALAQTGQVKAKSGQGPAKWNWKVSLAALADFAIFLQVPQGKDLDLAIWNQKGEPIGYGGSNEHGGELVLFSNADHQTVTIEVLNYYNTPVNFGVKVYHIGW